MASSSIRVCGAKSKAFRLTPLVAALLLVYPGIQARHAQADQSPANTPIANTKNTLPELGRPSDSPATLTPSQKGVTLDNRFDGKRLVVSPEYSDQTGLSLGGIFAFPLGDSSAGGLLLTAGNRKKELLFNAGFQMGDAQRLVLTLGQQRQHLNIGFLSGTEKTAMTQNNGAVSYQFRMEHGLFDSAEINAYLAVTPSRDLADKSYAVDTAALYELWNDPRRVAGGRVTGLQGRLAFTPLPGATFKLGAGGERQEYDYLTGKQSTTRATGSAEWVQCLAGGYQAKAGADVAVQNRYSLGLERSMDGGGLFGASFTGIRGKNGAPHDNQLKLTWSYTLDSKRTTPSRCGNAAQAWGNLLDQVAQRPGFLPAQVVAKLDTSAAPVRQIAVDKTALPAGSSVNTVTGAITTPLGIVATGIAGVTLNAAPFANTGQFALSGNSLVIDPNQIIQPAVGVTDTYVVTVNISGGGTSLVTVVVSRGSVRIDSITIVGGADVAGPTVGALNATSGVTTTGFTANWTKSTDNRDAQNQLQYLVYYGASGADFTSVANVKANGTAVGAYATDIATKAIGGLTENTTYKYTVMVKDTTGNESIYVAGTQATDLSADVAGPTVGALNATSGVTTTGFTANWTKSTDNRDAQNQLQYLVYYGASGADFTSVANVKANGTAVGAYATDIATKAIGGLTEYTTYKYTVMVKDTTGNESIYVAGTQATPDTTAPAITNTNVGARTVQTVTAGQYIEAAVTEASNLNASAINGANYTVTLDDGFGTTVVVGAANYTVTKSGVAPNYTLRITFDNAAAVPGAYGGGTISIVTANNTIRDASSNQIPVGTLIWSANIVP